MLTRPALPRHNSSPLLHLCGGFGAQTHTTFYMRRVLLLLGLARCQSGYEELLDVIKFFHTSRVLHAPALYVSKNDNDMPCVEHDTVASEKKQLGG